MPGGPIYGWDEISGNGAPIFANYPNWFTGFLQIGLSSGFTFPFYGNTYGDAFVGTDGYLCFSNVACTTQVSGPLPSNKATANAIFGFPADLTLNNPGAGAYYQFLSNPSRFVIEYQNFPSNRGGNVTFEIELFPSGNILLQYQSVTGTAYPADVGIQNDFQAIGLSYYDAAGGGVSSDAASAGTAVLFSYPAVSFATSADSSHVDVGSTTSFPVTLNNNSAEAQPFALSVSDRRGWPVQVVDGSGLPLTSTASLPPGGLANLSLQVTVPAGSAIGLSDLATLRAVGINDPTQATAVQVGVVAATYDLSLTVTSTTPPQNLTAGSQIQYQLSFNNAGAITAPSVVITDTLPAGATYLRTDSAGCTGCIGFNPTPVVQGNQVIYNVGSITANFGSTIYFTAQLDPSLSPGTSIVNQAQIAGTGWESNLANNAVTTSSAIVADTVDLQLTAGVNVSPCPYSCVTPTALPDQSLQYGSVVTNAGNSTAHSVIITETVPSGLTFVSATMGVTDGTTGLTTSGPVVPSVNGNQLSYTIGDLTRAGVGFVDPVFTVDSSAPLGSNLTMAFSATTIDSETSLGNNAANVVVQVVQPWIDLSASLRQNAQNVTAGSQLQFTLNVANTGNYTATNVLITDTLGSGLTYVSSTVTSCFDCGGAWPTLVSSQGNQVVYRLGSFLAAGSATIVVTAQVNADVVSGTSIVDQGQITGDAGIAYESNLANNYAAITAQVVPPNTDVTMYGLVLTPSQSIAPGGWVSYQFVVGNAGPVAASGVVLTDTLPPGASYVHTDSVLCLFCVGLSSTPVSTNGGQVVYNLGTVPIGALAYVDLTIQVDPHGQVGSTITNSAQVGFSGTDTNPSNNSVSLSSTLQVAQVNLSVAVTPTGYCPSPCTTPIALAGNDVSYAVTITNLGTGTASGVVLTETLPASTTFASATVNEFDSSTNSWVNQPITPTISGNQAVFSLSDLAAGGSLNLYPTLSVDPSVAVGTLLTNTVAASSIQPDFVPSNNTASTVVEVVAPTVDLSASLTVVTSSSYITPGGQVQYQLSYNNLGTVAAQNVVVTDTLPAGATYVSNAAFPRWECPGTAPTPTVNGNQLVYNVGAVNPGMGGCLNLAVQLDPATLPGTVITNTLQVGGTDSDTNPNNNVAMATSTVQTPLVDLVVSANTDGYCPAPCTTFSVGGGSSFTLVLAVTNAGNGTAHNVVVTDTLPANTSFQGAVLNTFSFNPGSGLVYAGPINPTNSGNVATFSVGDLAAVSGVYIFATLQSDPTIPTGTVLTNSVVASTTDADTNLANNSATNTDQIVAPQADLSITQFIQGTTQPAPGSTATVVLSFSNSSYPSGANSDGHNVLVTDTLPTGFSFSSATLTTCYIAPCGAAAPITPIVTGNTLAFSLGTVPILETGTITDLRIGC